MFKKTLLRGLNLLKLSTWLIAILSLVLLTIVAFFIMFPQTIKASLEEKLSQVSGLEVSVDRLSFEFQDNELLLAVKGVNIAGKDLSPIVSIDVLRWDANLLALYRGVEIPGHIDINELIIDSAFIDEYVALINTDLVLSNIGLPSLLALKSLTINRTKLVGDQPLELAPIEFKRNKQKIILSMRDQSNFGNSEIPKLGSSIKINTSIDVSKARKDRVAVIPFTLKNDDFNLTAQLKIFNEQDRVYLEFESYIDEIDVSKINQNLPDILANTKGVNWLNQVISEGILTDVMLTTRFNMSGNLEAPNTKFSANLNDANLNINPNWLSINELNAKIIFSNNYLKIVSNKAKLDDIDLSFLSITSRNFNEPNAKVLLNTKFNSSSEKISKFIENSATPQKFKNYLNEFKLEGGLWGNVNLVIPLQKDSNQKVEIAFDMYAFKNSLSLLDDKLSVNDFSSQISLKEGIIRTEGKGLIGGELFQLSLNPKEWNADKNSKLRIKISHLDSNTGAYLNKKSDNDWYGVIESKDLYADIVLLVDESGKYNVQLNDLIVSSVESIKAWQLSPEFFPTMSLTSVNAQVSDKSIPNFKADLINHENVMEIKNLTFEDIGLNDKDLIFNGSWFNGKTALRTKVSSGNLSNFLVKFGVNEPVIGGAFNADLRLYCNCEPWEVSIKKLSGFMKAEVDKGVFTNQDPNLFKLLSFINLETIANRLGLSRSELRERGYVYDQINANLLFIDGIAKVDYFLVESEESDIELTGFVNLVKRDYNLAANVQPSIADTVPLATYFAGGGLAGLGVWAADKMLFGGKVFGGLLDNVVEITFIITGAWSEPIIKKLDGVKVL